MDARTDTVTIDLRGYRWWRLGAGGWLRSPWNGQRRWEVGRNAAACGARRTVRQRLSRLPAHEDPVPSIACRCGFYAMHELPKGLRWPGLMWELHVESSGGGHGLIFGVAQASGTVLMGRNGWRAEHATIVALYASPDATANVDRLRRRYPVPIYRDLDLLISEWGPADEAESILRAS